MLKQGMSITGGLAGTMPTDWCVVEYAVADPAGVSAPTIMLITAVKLRDVFTLAECNRNSEWRKCVNEKHTIIAQIHWTGDRAECQREANSMIVRMNPRPRCNLYGYNSYSLARPLLCSNGQEYPTQAEACRVLNLNPSHLSRHLKGELKHVKTLVFAYKD